MGRSWILVEKERAPYDASRSRLERVVRGEDPTGITRAMEWTGGGSFVTKLR
jgi:hypothetical protein